MSIAKRAKAMREARNWSQETMAQNAGVGLFMVIRIERGLADYSSITASCVQRLARAFGVTMEEMMDGRTPRVEGPACQTSEQDSSGCAAPPG